MRWGKARTAGNPWRLIFAVLPTRLKDDTWIWLEQCWRYAYGGEASGVYDYYAFDATLPTVWASTTPTDSETERKDDAG